MRLVSAKRLRNGDEVGLKAGGTATVLSWSEVRLEDGSKVLELEVSSPRGIVTVTHREIT